jgi:ATP-binding cassette subfamily F protein 3
MIKTIMKEIGIDAGSLELVIMRNWLFCSNQASLLNENATIFETIDDIAVGMLELK